MGSNPVQKRFIIEGLKGVVESMLGSKAFSWRLFLYAIGILLATSWLPDGTTAFIKLLWKLIFVPCGVESGTFCGAVNTMWSEQKTDLLKFLVSTAFLLWVFVTIRRRIARQNIEVVRRPPEQVENLVVFLSDMPKNDIAEVIESPEQIKVGRKNWEMPYLAIEYHQKLRSLFVITSSDLKKGTETIQGTTHLFPDFKKFVKRAFPGREIDVVELYPGGIDFEDVKEVFNVIEDFYKKPEIKPKEVLVDITGGKKTNSIAGGIATLAMGRRFQYIGTNDKQVNAYDVGYFPGEHAQ
ncbi:MAG: hypothetical protein ACK41Q_12550 [Candidatus Brocadia sp.]